MLQHRLQYTTARMDAMCLTSIQCCQPRLTAVSPYYGPLKDKESCTCEGVRAKSRQDPGKTVLQYPGHRNSPSCCPLPTFYLKSEEHSQRQYDSTAQKLGTQRLLNTARAPSSTKLYMSPYDSALSGPARYIRTSALTNMQLAWSPSLSSVLFWTAAGAVVRACWQ